MEYHVLGGEIIPPMECYPLDNYGLVFYGAF